ncbi:MAG: hypothetical protein HY315_03305, partial [Acidobacteria bacterium]|nr:hypothetical protein [Acidobacteriota bacterium]
LASVLGLYTHYYFAFLICFQIVYWFFYGGVRFRAFFLDLCAIGLGFIPWLPMLLYQIGQKDHSDLWIRSQSPGATQLGQALLQGASVVTRFAAGENFTYPGQQEDWHKVLVVVLAIAAAALMQRPGLPMRSYHRLLWLWLLLPLLGGFLADLFFRTRTLEMSKYFIACYPALPMILASSIVHFRWQKARMVLLAALTLLNGYGLLIYYRVPTTVEWREVAAYLTSRIEPGDRVLSPEPRVYTCVRFYLDREIQFVRVPYDARTADVVRRARDGARSASRLWMISIHETFTPKLQGLSRQMESEFSLVSRQVISGHAVVSSFANRARALNHP